MSTSRGNRRSWEYADGPTVGEDVPITSPPREEESPGVPKPPPEPGRRDARDGGGRDGADREVREVRAEDPELSPDTNERLTSELRDVVGTDRVEVPADRPRATTGAGVHAFGTMTVGLTVIRLTTTSEHPSPTVAAAMAEEGVHNPDERFSRMVEEFRSEPERGASEMISPGFNERSAPADTETADAAAEQSSAMTPTSQPSQPGGSRGAPDALVWATMVSLLVLSIVLPPLTGGGWMWVLTAVMVPLLVGWGIFQRMMVTRRNQLHETVQGRGPLVAIVLCTALAVAAFCAVVAFAFQH